MTALTRTCHRAPPGLPWQGPALTGQTPAVRHRPRPCGSLPLRRLCALWTASLIVLQGGPALAQDDAEGARLFRGDVPLEARLQGADRQLPAAAYRCANCHRRSQDTSPRPGLPALPVSPVGARPDDDRMGTLLDAGTLMQDRERRGGPASRYDEASFCTVLREGVDPAWIILPRVMPRYRLSDTQCRDLWRYLTTPTEASGSAQPDTGPATDSIPSGPASSGPGPSAPVPSDPRPEPRP